MAFSWCFCCRGRTRFPAALPGVVHGLEQEFQAFIKRNQLVGMGCVLGLKAIKENR